MWNNIKEALSSNNVLIIGVQCYVCLCFLLSFLIFISIIIMVCFSIAGCTVFLFNRA